MSAAVPALARLAPPARASGAAQAIPDVCVIVEGTYPYVSGGVSSWLHALIGNLPEVTFTILHICSHAEPDRPLRYTLPPNVVGLRELALHDGGWLRPPSAEPCPSPIWHELADFHAALDTPGFDDAALMRQLCGPATERDTGRERCPDAHDLLYAPEAWELLVERYQHCAPQAPFADVFWTFRQTHLPLFRLLEAELPPARVYHSLSTGFGGFLGAIASLRSGAPFLLTEHGIYTREREIEIAQAEWIANEQRDDYRLTSRHGFFKAWWIGMFRFIARLAYQRAAVIVSITGVNQRYQLENGADPAKMVVIPNAVNVPKYAAVRRAAWRDPERFAVGFVGRVVPIKDVKTFLRAIKLVSASIPNLDVYIIGPTDEDPAYFRECRALTDALGLGAIVRYTGPADVADYYARIDLLVLTSLSEGQPLVILEANCAGVPVVASDVGACRELLEGGAPEDIALGPSGLVTPVTSPAATAQAIVTLARDPALRARMAGAGVERVTRFYREETLYSAYRAYYGAERRPTARAMATAAAAGGD